MKNLIGLKLVFLTCIFINLIDYLYCLPVTNTKSTDNGTEISLLLRNDTINLPPLYFPRDSATFVIKAKNKTMLQILQHSSDQIEDQQNIDEITNPNEQQKSSDPNAAQESTFISNIEDSYEDGDESSKTISKEEVSDGTRAVAVAKDDIINEEINNKNNGNTEIIDSIENSYDDTLEMDMAKIIDTSKMTEIQDSITDTIENIEDSYDDTTELDTTTIIGTFSENIHLSNSQSVETTSNSILSIVNDNNVKTIEINDDSSDDNSVIIDAIESGEQIDNDDNSDIIDAIESSDNKLDSNDDSKMAFIESKQNDIDDDDDDSNVDVSEDDVPSISDPKDEIENVQSNNEPETGLEEQFSDNDKLYDLSYKDDTVVDHPTIHNGHIAAIVAGALAFLFVCLYVGIVLWRNMINHKYGMRQRLVTEDDYYNNNDVRHFEL